MAGSCRTGAQYTIRLHYRSAGVAVAGVMQHCDSTHALVGGSRAKNKALGLAGQAEIWLAICTL